MSEIADLRRLNLKKWIQEIHSGVQAKFIEITDINQGELSSLLRDKSFGEKKARSIEKKANMPPMWLDTIHESHTADNGAIQTINKGVIKGNQIGVQNNSYNNHFVSEDEAAAQPNAHFYTAMPILGIDDAVEYALNPKEKGERIKDTAERAATFIPHTDRTFAVKVANNRLTALSQPTIQLNDILIIEPKIPPRDQDLVLICLDCRQATQRGMVARLFIDLRGKKTIKYAETDAEPMPAGALICGVVVEVKRRLLPNDLVASRIDTEWDIQNTLEKDML